MIQHVKGSVTVLEKVGNVIYNLKNLAGEGPSWLREYEN